MPMIVSANVSALLEAIAAGDEASVIRETIRLIGPENVPPAKVAARAGIAAAWAGGDGHPLATLAPVGRITLWMKSVPAGPEPDADERLSLARAVPLVQAFMAVQKQVHRGYTSPQPALPEPIFPAQVKRDDGVLGALREAISAHDLERVRGLLMGLYATGTDYRSLLTNIYATLAHRYPEGGHPLTLVVAGTRVLDMAEWGDRMPAFIYWVTPIMLDVAADTDVAEMARSYSQSEGHDLGWVRKRLSIPKEEAAGAQFQRAVVNGSATDACDAVVSALRDGATPAGVAAGLALAAAERVNSVPGDDWDGLIRAAHILEYAHSVHTVMLHTQNEEVWPLLYTAACAVNSVHTTGNPADLERGASSGPSATPGGLIAASMLRRLESQLFEGDTASALALARRYLQMGHPARALAGVASYVASSRDVQASQPYSDHIMPFISAAVEEYLALPSALAAGGYNPLLIAALRMASEFTSGHRVLDMVNEAISTRLTAQ